MRKGKEIDLLLAIRAKARSAVLASYPTDTASGDPANFPDGADGVPVVDLKAAIVPVQEGSGDPGPENIRPISGWTGARVTRSGKNILDPSLQVLAAYISVGTNTLRFSSDSALIVMPCKPSTTYSISLDPSAATTSPFRWAWTTAAVIENRTPVYDAVDITGTDSFTTGANATFLFVQIGKTYSETYGFDPVQVEYGAAATAYEHYHGSNYQVDWTSEAGTVYGGTLDVTTGLLTVTHGQITAYDGETLPGEWISDRDVYAEGTSPSAGAQVVYELAEPETFQLTPVQVRTLLGENNLWADCGAVAVEYRADLDLYIEKKIGEG